MRPALVLATLAAVWGLAACGDDGGDLSGSGVPAADAAPSAVPSGAGTDTADPAPTTPASATPEPAATDPATSESATAEPGTPEPSEPFTTTTLVLRGPAGEEVTVPAYVAADPALRGRGLMDRDALPADVGMVFLFPVDASGPFYMYRTRIPLSIAFFDADGRVVSVLDMEPCTAEDATACERYNPNATYRGALEVNRGYFDQVGVTEGWTVELPPGLPTPS